MLCWKWQFWIFPCKNLLDMVVEPNCFWKILDISEVVSSGFTSLSGKKIGGCFFLILLKYKYTKNFLFINLNFKNTYQCNRMAIMAQSLTFRLGWLDDSVTIWYMPLLNKMVMCGDASPDVWWCQSCCCVHLRLYQTHVWMWKERCHLHYWNI